MTLFSKLKQIQDLKKKAGELKNLLKDETAEINSDGVKIIMDGNQEVLEIGLDEKFLNPDAKEKLEKILKNNFNDAIKKVQALMAEKIRGSGIEMPKFN